MTTARNAAATNGMVWIEGGAFQMGSDRHYPEESPARDVRVDGFHIDPFTATNRQFAGFIAAAGYRTVAERALDRANYPGAAADMLRPGALVFCKARGPVDLRDMRNWWAWKPGACWRHPEGRGSSVAARLDHPVVQVAFDDPETYARWAGKCLPTEAEWEFAARGSLEDAEFAWGNEFPPGGRPMANTWQGAFPWENLRCDGFEGTSPIGVFPLNGYGLFDMAGNVWEWTTDWYATNHASAMARACCVPDSSRGDAMADSCDPAQPRTGIPRKVVKGGSFLCAPNYCRRYRPAARHAQMIDSGMSHIGSRCVLRQA
jgi:formylglycine-generating enzyme